MFGIGMPELLIILVIILIIFGVGKLPQIGSALGKGLRNFKTSVSDKSDNCNEPDKIEDEKK
jgi:sec-independent protein translocase protein TatA